MKKSIQKVITVVAIVLMGVGNGYSQNVYSEYKDGEVYFKLRDNVGAILPDYTGSEVPDYISDIVSKYNITKMYRPFALEGASLRMLNTYKIEFNDIDEVEDLIKDLKGKAFNEYAEKVPLKFTFATPADLLYSQQWALPRIAAPAAYDIFRPAAGKAPVTIAIVDNEINTDHEDLNGVSPSVPGILVAGRDVADNDNDTRNPAFNHGTHVAGIAGAITSFTSAPASPAPYNGIASLNADNFIRIMPVKSTPDAGPGNLVPFGYQGVQWAYLNGARIISLSWGGPGFAQTEQNIINDAINNGCIVVAAAGNDYKYQRNFPAAFPDAISVAATDNNDSKTTFSTWHESVDVCAPGLGIISSISSGNNTYNTFSGTSMATPLVAGLCGMMWAYQPSLTSHQIITCLKASCDNISSAPGNNNIPSGMLGAGRINAQKALQCLTGPPIVDFTSDFTRVCTAVQQVTFQQLTAGQVTSYSWTFQGGTPATSPSPTPVVMYNTPGTYNVTLTATGPGGSNSLTKTAYITVGSPNAQITGLSVNSVCAGTNVVINLDLLGTPPFTVTLNNGSFSFTANNILTSPATVIVPAPSATASFTMTLTSMNDNFCTGTTGGSAPYTTITCCNNLVENGNFETGVITPSTSELGLNCVTQGNGKYCINNFSTTGSGSWNMGNPIPGLINRGRSMYWDGFNPYDNPPNPPPHTNPYYTKIWCQNLTLSNSKTYNISFFSTINGIDPIGPEEDLKYQFMWNNNFIGSVITYTPVSSPTQLNWHQVALNFAPPATLQADICICQVNTHIGNGNDILIDDISIREVGATLPPVDLGTDLSICSEDCINLGPAATPGFTYNWTASTGINPSGTSPVNVCPTITTTYTLTVTSNSSGCVAGIDDIVVNVRNNCCTGQWNAPASITSSTVIAFPAYANAAINQNCTISNGASVIFDNINVSIGTNVKIVISSGSNLIIQNSAYLQACSQMWDGIYVNPGGNLIVRTNGRVEDAKQAIVSINGGLYNITNGILNRNYKNIVMQQHSGSDHPGRISNSIIACRDFGVNPTAAGIRAIYNVTNPVYPPSPSPTNLKPPFATEKPLLGVQADNVVSAWVGQSGSAYNIFDNLLCGVWANNVTNLRVFTNKFFNILPNPPCPLPSALCPPVDPCIGGICPPAPLAGAAIDANTGGNFYGGVGTTTFNTFRNCVYGEHVRNYPGVNIQRNIFRDITETAIRENSSTFNTHTISYNTITNAKKGIHSVILGPTYTINGTIAINNNTITNDGTSSITSNEAVFVETSGVTNPVMNFAIHPFIQSNSISNFATGIWLRNHNYNNILYTVKTNTVTALPGSTFFYGVRFTNSDFNTITQNKITGGSLDVNVKGISVENSDEVEVLSNTVKSSGKGIFIFGSSIFSVYKCNKMDQDDRGIALFSANLGSGDQGSISIPSDNQWIGTISLNSDIIDEQLSVQSRWWRRKNVFPFDPAIAPFQSPVEFDANINASSCSPAPPLRVNPNIFAQQSTDNLEYSETNSLNGEEDSLKSYLVMLSEKIFNSSFSDEHSYYRDKYIYRLLRKRNSLMDKSGSNGKKLYDFFQSIDKTNHKLFSDFQDAVDKNDMAGAKSINSGIVPVNTIESNLKTYNEIYISSIGSGKNVSPNQQNDLLSVASQCAIKGGPAVYYARTLLGIATNTTVDFPDDCKDASPVQRKNIMEANEPLNYSARLYPNPNNGQMQLEYELAEKETGLFVIFDLSGRKIKELALPTGKHIMEINSAELETGIYYYRVIINGIMAKSDKLTIIK